MQDTQEDEKESMGGDHSTCKDAEAGNMLMNFGDRSEGHAMRNTGLAGLEREREGRNLTRK